MSFGRTPGESDEEKQARLAQEAIQTENQRIGDRGLILSKDIANQLSTPGRDATILTRGTYTSPSQLNGPAGSNGKL